MSSGFRIWQIALNKYGFKDYEGKKLKVDGIRGRRTIAAISMCKVWQRWLNSKGFNVGKVDGWPGVKWVLGCKAFQRAAGLHYIDAIIGPETINARKHWTSRINKITRKVTDIATVVFPWPRIKIKDVAVIHYSYSDFGNVAIIDSWHKARGWLGIGYDFVIGNGNQMEDGEEEATWRYLKNKRGAHCGWGYNKKAYGICFIGTDRPTEKQWESLVLLLKWLEVKEVLGHKEAAAKNGHPGYTSCPGNTNLDALRKEVLG